MAEVISIDGRQIDPPDFPDDPGPSDPPAGAPVEFIVREVVVGMDIERLTNDVIAALGAAPIYQRSGALVDTVRAAEEDEDGTPRPSGVPRIRLLPLARLYELITTHCKFIRFVKDEETGKKTKRRVPVPDGIEKTVNARGEWAHLRPLRGVTEWPVLRPDGSILFEPGYDRRTGLICENSVAVDVPDQPTQADARAALDILRDLVGDFPFAKGCHREAWIAVLLTLIARPAIDGPTPLGLLDASERGTGKTLLADLLGMLLRGKRLPRRTAPDDGAEWSKAMLAIAIAADPVVLIDNVTKMLRSDALDAVLTGTAFRGRILGRNEELSLEISTVFLVSSNNATLSADLVRRSLHIRLEAKDERPEHRTNFRNPDLIGHALKGRSLYLSAALTILRGYLAARRPDVGLRPLGSYEAWSGLVRNAIVWAGGDDPAATQDGLREGSDPEGDVLARMLPAWHACYQERGVTCAALVEDLGHSELPPKQRALRDILIELVDAERNSLPTPAKLGYRFRRLRDRVRAGILFERAGESAAGNEWRTRVVNELPNSTPT